MKRIRSRAFTFIEIMFVVVIIGILVALAVPRFGSSSKEAKITATRTELATLENCITQFEMHTSRYPTNSEGLRALMEEPSGLKPDLWNGPYIKRGDLPEDEWHNPYNYLYPGKKDDFDLWSSGPDGTSGTADDVWL